MNRIPIWILPVLVFAFSVADLAACASGDDDDDSGDDSGDDDSGDDNTGGDDDDSGGDDDSTDANLWGVVYVNEGMSSATVQPLGYFNYAGAVFFTPENYAIWYALVETEGSCQRFFFDIPLPFTWDYLDAGPILISGANVSPIHLTDASYQYGWLYSPDYAFQTEDDLFDPGDAISFGVAGNIVDIPAFSGQVTAPEMVEVTAPADFDDLTSVGTGDFTVS
jgi:hypothetical protein